MKLISRFLAAAAAGAVVAAVWPHRIAQLLKVIFPQIVWDGKPSTGALALTFDDGPDPVFTPKILEVLKRYNIKATFFLVGEQARRYPAEVHNIRALGHEIGNHTDSWHRTVLLNSKDF